MSAALPDGLRPQAGSTSPTVDPSNLEENIVRVRDLNTLAQWIVSARDTLEQIQAAAERDPAFEERLRFHEIPFNSPSWNSFESSALCRLHMIVEENINQIAAATINAPRAMQ